MFGDAATFKCGAWFEDLNVIFIKWTALVWRFFSLIGHSKSHSLISYSHSLLVQPSGAIRGSVSYPMKLQHAEWEWRSWGIKPITLKLVGDPLYPLSHSCPQDFTPTKNFLLYLEIAVAKRGWIELACEPFLKCLLPRHWASSNG